MVENVEEWEVESIEGERLSQRTVEFLQSGDRYTYLLIAKLTTGTIGIDPVHIAKGG